MARRSQLFQRPPLAGDRRRLGPQMSRPETRRLTASQFRIIPYWDHPVSLSSPRPWSPNPPVPTIGRSISDHAAPVRGACSGISDAGPSWGKVDTVLPETVEAASTLRHLHRANCRSMALSASGFNHDHRDGEAERPQLAGGPLVF